VSSMLVLMSTYYLNDGSVVGCYRSADVAALRLLLRNRHEELN